MPENKCTSSVPGVIIACTVSLLAGIGGTVLYYDHPAVHEASRETAHEAPSSHDDWIKLSADGGGEVLTYSTDALFKSDIKLPPVRSFSGKSKFVTDLADRKSQIKLGYVVDVDIAPLDPAKLPESYKNPNPENPASKSVAPQAVDYDVVFYFVLKDKDGFPLMKVASNAETVHSGTNNHFQLFAKNYIPQAVVANTRIVTARIEAVKCLTCNHGETDDPPPAKHKRRSLFGF